MEKSPYIVVCDSLEESPISVHFARSHSIACVMSINTIPEPEPRFQGDYLRSSF